MTKNKQTKNPLVSKITSVEDQVGKPDAKKKKKKNEGSLDLKNGGKEMESRET